MTAKVMVSIPHEFLEEVDRVAEEEFRSRSELIREALRHYMDKRHRRGGHQPTVRPGDLPQVQAAVESLRALAQAASHSVESSDQEQGEKRPTDDIADHRSGVEKAAVAAQAERE